MKLRIKFSKKRKILLSFLTVILSFRVFASINSFSDKVEDTKAATTNISESTNYFDNDNCVNVNWFQYDTSIKTDKVVKAKFKVSSIHTTNQNSLAVATGTYARSNSIVFCLFFNGNTKKAEKLSALRINDLINYLENNTEYHSIKSNLKPLIQNKTIIEME